MIANNNVPTKACTGHETVLAIPPIKASTTCHVSNVNHKGQLLSPRF
jgi:hypothetical protein